MPTPYLSVAIIAKNEEELLPELFASLTQLAPINYEVCFVDTGSTDKTVEIARSNGARVRSIEWADDYAAARNAALDMARGAWVLSLDADEHVKADGAALLRELKLRERAKPTQFAINVHVQAHHHDNGSVVRWRVSRLIRVGHARWIRPVHEGVIALETDHILGAVVPEAALTILNEGFYGEERNDASMNLKEQILERFLRKQERDGASPNDLALTYFDLARSYLFTQPDNAGEIYRRGCLIKGADEMLPKLQQHYAQYLLVREEWDAAEPLVEELERIAPIHGVTKEYTAWQRGCLLLGKNNGREALKIFRELGEVTDVLGLAVSPQVKLRRILNAAALAGDEAEAIAAAVKLVGGCADGEATAPLMNLWQARPTGLLVRLLKQAGAGESQGPTLEAVAEALRADPRGEKVAAALLESA